MELPYGQLGLFLVVYMDDVSHQLTQQLPSVYLFAHGYQLHHVKLLNHFASSSINHETLGVSCLPAN